MNTYYHSEHTITLTPKDVDVVVKALANKFFPHMDDDHGIACVEDLLIIDQNKKDSLKKIKKSKKISTKKSIKKSITKLVKNLNKK